MRDPYPLHARVTVEFLDNLIYRHMQTNKSKGLTAYTPLVLDLFEYRIDLFGTVYLSVRDQLKEVTKVSGKITLIREQVEMLREQLIIAEPRHKPGILREIGALYNLAHALIELAEAHIG